MHHLFARLVFVLFLSAVAWATLDSNTHRATAQTPAVSHSITSWNYDGTATASITLDLPSVFADKEGTITASVECDDNTSCDSSDVAIEGTKQSGVTLRLLSQLSPGDDNLSITVTARVTGGGSIEHKVDDYVISVPEPQSLLVDFTKYDVVELHDDGSADLSFSFAVQRADDWPVHQFRAAIACVETHPCGTITSVSPGWGINAGAAPVHTVNLFVKRVAQGDRRLHASFYDTTEQWTGPARHDSQTFVDVAIPIAQKPEIELTKTVVSSTNEDESVNATLDFTLKRTDSWPMSSIRASLACADDVECEVEEVITPAWVDDETATEHVWQAVVNNLPQGYVRLSATFEPQQDAWFGPPRAASLDGLLIDARDTDKYNVSWQSSSSTATGYYMDGSALLDLTVSAKILGTESVINDHVTSVCYTTDLGDLGFCQVLETAGAVSIGAEDSTVTVPGLRLPQGDGTLRIFAGKASGDVDVSVPERIVGFRRDMWDCFTDTNPIQQFAKWFGTETCSGFQNAVVRKWTLESVNVYRVGDPTYVQIFDDAISVMHSITGIDYVYVDDPENAQLEAYLGHNGHSRILELLGESCNTQRHCSHSYSSTDASHTVDRGMVTILHRGEVTLGEGSRREEGLRILITDYLRQTLIPVGRQLRPFLQANLDASTSLRPHDVMMYRLIYSPDATPGISFQDLRELVVFDDETLDYVPTLPPPDLVAYKVLDKYFESGSISITMTGKDIRGNAEEPGPSLTVHYSDFSAFESNRIRFSSENRDSIIFGYGAETWVSDEDGWAISDDQDGIGRQYRDETKFDFPLTDPTSMLFTEVFSVYSSSLSENEDAHWVSSVPRNDLNTNWPEPQIEIIIDPDTYQMVSYTIHWFFDADNSERTPYRVEAQVIDYGAAFEIPDEVSEDSEYLAELNSE